MPHVGSNPELRRLDALVGDWTMQAPPHAARGETSFAWLEGGFFLVQRWSVEAPEAPDGIAIIGQDPATGSFSQHYYDSRGVSRVYGMSLSDGVWKLWRDDPDFSQRFAAESSHDGTTMTGRWESSSDGSNWEHDFDLIYTKVR